MNEIEIKKAFNLGYTLDTSEIKSSLKDDLRRVGIDKQTKHAQALNEVVDALTGITLEKAKQTIGNVLLDLQEKAELYDSIFNNGKINFDHKMQLLEDKLSVNSDSTLTDQRAIEAYTLYTKILTDSIRVVDNSLEHKTSFGGEKTHGIPVDLMQDLVHASSYTAYAYLAGDKMSQVVFNKSTNSTEE